MGAALRWTWDGREGERHSGLFALVGEEWQGDGVAFAPGKGGTLSIFDGDELRARELLELPSENFVEAPRLSVGSDSIRLAWKLRGKLPLRLSFTLEGEEPILRLLDEEGETAFSLPPGFRGQFRWRLDGGGRLLAEERGRAGFRELLSLPGLPGEINDFTLRPLVVDDCLLTLLGNGYLACLAPELSKRGTRLSPRWLWSEEAVTRSTGQFRDCWDTGNGFVECLREDGALFRLSLAWRQEIWERLRAASPSLPALDRLALAPARRLEPSMGERKEEMGHAVLRSRHVQGDGELLLLASETDFENLRFLRRKQGAREWQVIERWQGRGLIDLVSLEPGRFLALTALPSNMLSLLSFRRGHSGWKTDDAVDLGVRHEGKHIGRAHCPAIAMPGRNLALVACGKQIFSVVLLPDGEAVVARTEVPGPPGSYVEGLVPLSPHRAVALTLQPLAKGAMLAEVTRRVMLVEIALEDPLKPTTRAFTIIPDNMRLQGGWHVHDALQSSGDHLCLVLGSEVAVVAATAPFSLQHRYPAFDVDHYLNRGFLFGRSFLAFHKDGGCMGIDLSR